jgi:predicted nucleotidyltransferase
MHKLCRIDIGRGKEIYKEIDGKLKELAKKLRMRYNVSTIIVFGSYVRAAEGPIRPLISDRY